MGTRYLADGAESAGGGMCRLTAWRICSAGGWTSTISKKGRGRHRKAGPPVHYDLVERNFTAVGPAELWLTDIPEHWTAEGSCTCARSRTSTRADRRLFDRHVMKSRLDVNALNSAVARRGGVTGCVLHGDRGSQFRSKKMQKAIRRHGMLGSVGRVGASGDNAAVESFFSLLQNNVLDRVTLATGDELRSAIVRWVERTYHRRRRQDRLGRLTPH